VNEQTAQTLPTLEADGWEWMLVEIMGHRTHWGRARQEERFGAKMLRIDVPKIVNFERTDPSGPAVRLDPPRVEWVTHYYGGPSIFSFMLTDEATVMARNKPYEPPSRLSLPAPEGDDDGFDDGGPI
jgi:hypothetical protein